MPSIQELVAAEGQRQANTLSLIASENHTSKAVQDLQASCFGNKYAEGYPAARYYAGNQIADQLETMVQQLAQTAFATDYAVNVQPYSGTPANLAIYAGLLKPGDTILSLSLNHGGHLSHGHRVSLPGALYKVVSYGVSAETCLIDMQEVTDLAEKYKPAMIVCGGSAYSSLIPFTQFASIAARVGAILLADISHIAGLVVGGVHPTPFGLADIVMTTTHKTLRGPRAALIFSKPAYGEAVNKGVFPGVQGGPHLNTIAAVGQALVEASSPQFTRYAHQVVANAKQLAFSLSQLGARVVGEGTDTHLFLLDVTSLRILGQEAQQRLEEVGLVCNKNLLPFDTQPPRNPSGIRLGTAALTSRGMKEPQMQELAEILYSALTKTQSRDTLGAAVQSLCRRHRIPTHY
jgi:glycine hydroxymethyltransferase